MDGVEIQVSATRGTVPKGLPDLLKEIVVEAGFNRGIWSARITGSAHGRGTSQGIPGAKVKNVNRRDIRLILQPGDNGTCRELSLRVPDGFSPSDVQKRLKSVVNASAAASPTPAAKSGKGSSDREVVQGLRMLFENREVGDLYTFLGMLPILMMEVETGNGEKEFRLNVRDASELLTEDELDLFFEFLIEHRVLVPVGSCTDNYRNCVFELNFEYHGRLVKMIAEVVGGTDGAGALAPSKNVLPPQKQPAAPKPAVKAADTAQSTRAVSAATADPSPVKEDPSPQEVASSSEDRTGKPALEGIWLERGQMIYKLSGGKNFGAHDQHVWGNLSRNQRKRVTEYFRAGGYLRTTGNTTKTEYIWLPRGHAELPRTSGTDQEPIAAPLEPSASPVTDEPLAPPPVSEAVSQPPLDGFDVHLPESRLSGIAESMTTAALSSVRGSLAARSEELRSELARLDAADRVISCVLDQRESKLRAAREALENLSPDLRAELLKQYSE